MNNCKGCNSSAIITKEEIELEIEKLRKLEKIEFVPDIVYQKRLLLCENCEHCEHLTLGTTCMKCGCIVQIKAKLANGKCPLKKSKWE